MCLHCNSVYAYMSICMHVCTCACPYTCMFVCAQLGTAYRRLWMTSGRKMLQQLCAWSFTSPVWMTQSEYIHLINNLYFLPSVTKSDISFYWLTLCHRLSFYCICMITSDDVLLKQCAYIFVCVHVHLYIHVCACLFQDILCFVHFVCTGRISGKTSFKVHFSQTTGIQISSIPLGCKHTWIHFYSIKSSSVFVANIFNGWEWLNG